MHTDAKSNEHLNAEFSMLYPNVPFQITNVSSQYQSAVLSLVTGNSKINNRFF